MSTRDFRTRDEITISLLSDAREARPAARRFRSVDPSRQPLDFLPRRGTREDHGGGGGGDEIPPAPSISLESIFRDYVYVGYVYVVLPQVGTPDNPEPVAWYKDLNQTAMVRCSTDSSNGVYMRAVKVTTSGWGIYEGGTFEYLINTFGQYPMPAVLGIPEFSGDYNKLTNTIQIRDFILSAQYPGRWSPYSGALSIEYPVQMTDVGDYTPAQGRLDDYTFTYEFTPEIGLTKIIGHF